MRIENALRKVRQLPGLRALAGLCGLLVCLLGTAASVSAAPATGGSLTNTYHGVEVIDRFGWLEDRAAAETLDWVRRTAEETRGRLDQLPDRPYVLRSLGDWFREKGEVFRDFSTVRGEGFVLVAESRFAPFRLVRFPESSLYSNRLEQLRVVADPASRGLGMEIGWYSVSPDATRAAILLRPAKSLGPERRLVVWDLTGGQPTGEEVAVVEGLGRGGSVGWLRDGTGFLYTDHRGGRPSVRLHRLGHLPDEEEHVTGLPASAELQLLASSEHSWIALSAFDAVRDERSHWLRAPDGTWRLVAGVADRVTQVDFGRDPIYIESPRDEGLYLLSRDRAPLGKLVRVPLSKPSLAGASVILPEGKEPLTAFRRSASGIYASYQKSGGAELRFYDLYEKEPLKTPVVMASHTPSSLREAVVMRGDQIVYCRESYITPREWFLYDPNRDAAHAIATPLYDSVPLDLSDSEVQRVSVKTPEGGKIPLFILQRKGTRQTGESPLILTPESASEGGQAPSFDLARRAWLSQGGVIAVAQVRGVGGESRPEWREGGVAANLRDSVEELLACARYLVASNYTRVDRLALTGAGQGAFVVLSAAMQDPGAAAAVVADDPGCDLLRGSVMAGGGDFAARFGTPEAAGGFELLRGLSPYGLVRNHVPYPPILLRTGFGRAERFPEVHAWKMAARLEEAVRPARSVLLDRAPSEGPSPRAPGEVLLERMADAYAFLFDRLGVGYSLVDRGPWSGGVTTRSAVVKARLSRDGMRARLLVSRTPRLNDPLFFGPALSTGLGHNLVSFELPGLVPDTQYHYALEVDGRLDWPSRGEFRTFPEGPASFKVAFASCAKTASTLDVFDRIRENRPLFFMNTGDFHYLNISSNNIELFRGGYDYVLSSPEQSDLYRHIPFVYMWDDHDYGGNNSNRKSSSHEAARRAYEEYVPHYPLAAGGGDQPIYQSFAVGRVKFILTDLRSDRDDVKKPDDARKSMMGERQKAWFKQELLSANGVYPLICWVSSVPWLGQAGSNYYWFVKGDQHGYFHHTNALDASTRTNKAKAPVEEDHWCVFSSERREIADFIKANQIRGVCILHGDSHMLAADDGSNGDFATGGGAPIPVFCAAPLDQTPSLKGGPYSQGVYRVKANEGCFGLLEVTDRGSQLDVALSGRNNQNQEKISLRFTLPATPPQQPSSPPPRR